VEAYRLVDLLGVKPCEHLVPDHQGWGGAALVAKEFADVLRIVLYVALLKTRASLREVCLDPGAGRSSGL